MDGNAFDEVGAGGNRVQPLFPKAHLIPGFDAIDCVEQAVFVDASLGERRTGSEAAGHSANLHTAEFGQYHPGDCRSAGADRPIAPAGPRLLTQLWLHHFLHVGVPFARHTIHSAEY